MKRIILIVLILITLVLSILWQGYCIIVTLVLLFLMMPRILKTLTVCGLILSIIGSGMLAMYGLPKIVPIYEEGETVTYNGGEYFEKKLIVTKRLSGVAVLLLIGGFFFQLAGQFIKDKNSIAD